MTTSPTLPPLDRNAITEALSDLAAAERALGRIDLRRLRGNAEAKETVRIVRDDLKAIRSELANVA